MIHSKKLPSIFLIGPMGAGKTTIGRLLSRQLQQHQFVDVDRYIEEQTGAEVSWIFSKEGEQSFRSRETKAIESLTTQSEMLLATGGGVVLSDVNRQLLSERGLVIYLNADVDTQLQRTANSTHRPLLDTANPREVLQKLYSVRDPLYKSIADIEVISGRYYPKKMVFEILYQISQLGYEIPDNEVTTINK